MLINNLNDIKNQTELNRLIETKKKEIESIEIAIPLLEQLDIIITSTNQDRFALFDCEAISGLTEDNEGETIYLEFKYRYNINSNDYNSVIIDSIKARELYNIYKEQGIRTLIVYVYKDKHIRLFDFSTHYREYCNVKESTIQYSTYRPNIKKKQNLIEYPNELTVLV